MKIGLAQTAAKQEGLRPNNLPPLFRHKPVLNVSSKHTLLNLI